MRVQNRYKMWIVFEEKICWKSIRPYLCNPLKKNKSSSNISWPIRIKKSGKIQEKFCWNHTGTYLCTPIKKLGGRKCQKIFESLEATARKLIFTVRFSDIINRSHTLIFLKNYWRQMVKTHLQWRVWSWLRMNASGRLNTCKSWGSAV